MNSSDPSAFGKYRLIAELGHGGMADVFLAVNQGPAGFSKLVVLKRLRAQIADDPEFVAMLVDEARLAARLNHPNVVQTNEVGNVGTSYYIAMEFLDGQPFHRIQHRSRGTDLMPTRMHVAVLSDVLSGLQHAHELADFDGTPLNVVHRDVTPHNIFVTYDGQVKVVDFGIAKAAGRGTAETRAGVIKGKVAYMSPEQAMCATLDARADLFAVGVMLWEAATGRRMWKGAEDLQILHRLISGEVPISPRAIVPEVPEELDRICQRALAIRREDRYPSAAAMQLELEAYVQSNGGRPTPRDIGKAVSELFKDRREELKVIVEAKLAELKSMPASEFVVAAMESGPHSMGSLSSTSLRKPAAAEVTPPSGQDVTKLTGADITGATRASASGRGAPRMLGVAIISAAALLAATAIGITRQSKPVPGNGGVSQGPAAVTSTVTGQAAITAIVVTPDAGAARGPGSEEAVTPPIVTKRPATPTAIAPKTAVSAATVVTAAVTASAPVPTSSRAKDEYGF